MKKEVSLIEEISHYQSGVKETSFIIRVGNDQIDQLTFDELSALEKVIYSRITDTSKLPPPNVKIGSNG